MAMVIIMNEPLKCSNSVWDASRGCVIKLGMGNRLMKK